MPKKRVGVEKENKVKSMGKNPDWVSRNLPVTKSFEVSGALNDSHSLAFTVDRYKSDPTIRIRVIRTNMKGEYVGCASVEVTPDGDSFRVKFDKQVSFPEGVLLDELIEHPTREWGKDKPQAIHSIRVLSPLTEVVCKINRRDSE